MEPSSATHAVCVGDNTLAAYAEGRVEPQERGPIEGHLARCAECRLAVARAEAAASQSGGHLAPGTGPDSPAMDALGGELRPGARVSRYVVERLIGRGAMGAVYAARDPALGRTVAIKILRPDAWSEEQSSHLRARLLREAQAMARLSHPCVISVHDVGPFGEQLFIAMEYVEGGTLRQWLAARPRTVADIVAVYERAGAGLAAAHEAGIVHRDFKPDNVLVGVDGRVRVTDFGLARTAGLSSVSTGPAMSRSPSQAAALTITLTREGTLLGTPAYMAPEQLQGLVADVRSDVFSFCVGLHEALYGRRPFAGGTLISLRTAIGGDQGRAVSGGPSIPVHVQRALERGLRAAPDQRFQSMRGLLEALASERAPRGRVLLRIASLGVGALAILATMHGLAAHTLAERAEPPVSGRISQAPVTRVHPPATDDPPPTASPAPGTPRPPPAPGSAAAAEPHDKGPISGNDARAETPARAAEGRRGQGRPRPGPAAETARDGPPAAVRRDPLADPD